MNAFKSFSLTLFASALLIPAYTQAHEMQAGHVGPQEGAREFSLSGTGASDKDFDNSSFGLSADLGWYLSDRTVAGVRQSIIYADVQGANLSNDFWSGSTRGYIDYHFGNNKLRPFIGATLGYIYGDGVKDTGVAGPEAGLKYYVLDSTYILGRIEYQFLFDSGGSASDNYDDGSMNYVVGVGFNF